MNNTYKNVISLIKQTERTWNKVKDNLNKITLVDCRSGLSYGLCYNNVFLGLFLKKEYVDLNELKDTPFTYDKSRLIG